MFHVKQFEGGSRFGLSVGGRAGLSRVHIVARAARGIACATRRASGEAVRRGVIVSRETHVHGDGICSRCSLEVGASPDSMKRRCPSMRFYGAKMGVYEL